MKVKFNHTKVQKMFFEKDMIRCEKCNTSEWLSFAHRHKRRWYLNKGDLINDFNQILLLCVPCHERIERSKTLTEELFNIKRGIK